MMIMLPPLHLSSFGVIALTLDADHLCSEHKKTAINGLAPSGGFL